MSSTINETILADLVNKLDRMAACTKDLEAIQIEYIEACAAYEERLNRCLEVMYWAEDKLRKLSALPYYEGYTEATLRTVAEALSDKSPKNDSVERESTNGTIE